MFVTRTVFIELAYWQCESHLSCCR